MKPAASTTSKIAAAVNELTQGGHRVALTFTVPPSATGTVQPLSEYTV